MRFFCVLLLSCTFSFSPIYANGTLELYFSNDSVNGIKVSDAYETHNMGFLYSNGNAFYGLDLGIVSPDMHVYKNQYRVANRSFGEVVTFTAGRNFDFRDAMEAFYYIKVKSAGSYGIDRMQDFMHRLLTLQPVNAVNDLVRMPDQTWVGIGGAVEKEFIQNRNQLLDFWGIEGYLGSDKLEIVLSGNKVRDIGKLQASLESGMKMIFFDEIVSAPPISADHRNLIPYVQVGLAYKSNGVKWFVADTFSLPTIKNDNSIFGVLSAGVTIPLD